MPIRSKRRAAGMLERSDGEHKTPRPKRLLYYYTILLLLPSSYSLFFFFAIIYFNLGQVESNNLLTWYNYFMLRWVMAGGSGETIARFFKASTLLSWFPNILLEYSETFRNLLEHSGIFLQILAHSGTF